MKYPLVSVVIPVYNSEQTLDNCLHSVITQSYLTLEIIVVNDCSTDDSLAIMKKYAELDSRIFIVDKNKNEGLVYARKTGVDVAKGKYVQYLDSDDTLREGAITCLVEKAEKTQADMVVAPFFFSIEGRLENSLFFDFEELQGIDYLRYLLSWEAHWCVWSKFHLRALYEHDIERPNISLGEDIILSAQLLFYSKKVVCIHKEIVDYNFTPSSMSHPENFDDFKYEDFNGYVDWINNYVAKKGLLSKLRREMACFNLKTVLMRLHWNKIEDVDKRMKGVIADLKQFPDLQGILTRRERKIVAVYRFSSWLGYLNLKRYKKQEKL